MVSACGRYVIVFNGEIYNFRAIRTALEKEATFIPWRGQSDTEVLVEAVAHWGLMSCLTRLIGMFSFALYDRKKNELVLCRDRFGEKPLYFGWIDNSLLFASELKAFKRHPKWQYDLNIAAVTEYVRYGYVTAPNSIFRGVWKLKPGHYLSLKLDVLSARDNLDEHIKCYWSITDEIRIAHAEASTRNETEIVDDLAGLLENVIRCQMVADVPLGAFLSGGVDSSVVVAIMQTLSSRPVKTFTIGFDDCDYNEANYAQTVADYLKTDHTEVYVNEDDALAIIPDLASIYDEPFADTSQIPTYLLAKLTREHVTVCLSGDGGDEIFCGYNRYLLANDIWNRFGWMNHNFKKGLANLIALTPDMFIDKISRCIPYDHNKYGRKRLLSHKLNKFADILMAESQMDLYRKLTSIVQDPKSIMNTGAGPEESDHNVDCRQHAIDLDFYAAMMIQDQTHYLPDDILVKVDRAAMSVSLETRIPFLDHRVFAFSWRLPAGLRVRHGQGKWLLRQLLQRYVPVALFQRPKRGFGLPLHIWLRGGLAEWGASLVDSRQLRSAGVFRPEVVSQMWQQHLRGETIYEGTLWNILMFQAWYENEKSAVLRG
jgi:asparagine synthase (glutamine-hydrolysing)